VEWQWSSKRIEPGTLPGFRYIAEMPSLVGLRERRERVIARLTECYERDLLDVDELDRLLDQAHAASTVAELDVLVAGLGADVPGLLPITPHATHDPSRLDRKTLTVMFSHMERTGHWVVPRHLELKSLFGVVVLDFRDASIAAGVTTLDIAATFGNIELLLPPWLSIDVDVASLGGTVEERHRVPREPDPSEPVLCVTGLVRFGELTMSTRLPGETRNEALKREKHERKHGARRALARGQM
jgi:Cell wall-active antibiotics response 4TMS YvqF/Domain of unknown function (DUF1707)